MPGHHVLRLPDRRAASFAILDRFREAGGTFLDTANNYGQWHGDAGESERVIGRWLRSRRAAGEMVIATKVGARTTVPGHPEPRHWQGLGALADLADSGQVGLLGASNTALWRLAQARELARQAGRPGYSCVQQQYTYLLAQPERGQVNVVTEELLDYAAADGLTVLAYSPLLAGAYARPDRALGRGYTHPGSQARLAVLREVAADLGVTPNQVVLAWLLRKPQPVIPIPGTSTVAQLEEILGAVDVPLDAATLDRLDQAGRTTEPAPAL